MWPFAKRVLGRKVSNTPPMPVGDIRRQCVQQMSDKPALESDFPLVDAEGRLICKGCGAPYDTNTLEKAVAMVRKQILEFNPDPAMLVFSCRRCSRQSVVSPKEVITGKPADPFAPWTDEELEAADRSLESLFRFTPEERKIILPEWFHTVLYLYR